MEEEALNSTEGASSLFPAELSDIVDAVAKAMTVDYEVLEPAALRRCLSTITTLRNSVDALDARVLAAADNPAVFADGPTGGSATLRAYLCSHTNGRRGTVSGRTNRAHKLLRMPLVRDAFEAGHITADHVRLLGELTQPRFYEHFIEAEANLVQWATEMTWDDFKQTIDKWRTAADETEPDLKDESDQQARSLNLSKSFQDRGLLDGTITPEARVLIKNELDRITRQLLEHDRAEARARLGTDKITNADLKRTATQRRHDALVIMARRSNGAEPGTDMATPIVYVRASIQCIEAALQKAAGLVPDSVAPEDYECELEDGTPLTYDQLARYVISGHLRSVALSQEGEVLHYGDGRRFFSKQQKQAMAYRDRYCECGCGLLARQVDADHHRAWLDNGWTDIENARPKCRTTHTRKTTLESSKRRQNLRPTHPERSERKDQVARTRNRPPRAP